MLKTYHLKNASPYALAFLFLIFAACFLPLATVVWMGPDEGFELIKASLVSRGFQLYTQIWNDQPPLHTWLLASCFKIFGETNAVARGLTLFFTFILLVSYINCLKSLRCSGLSLFAGVLILITAPQFLNLSSAAMLEVPAMSCGLLTVALMWHSLRQKSSKYYLSFYLSSLIFVLALQIKLTAVIFFPSLLFLLFIDKFKSKAQKLTWLALLTSSFLVLSFLSKQPWLIFFKSHTGLIGKPLDLFPFLRMNKELMALLVILVLGSWSVKLNKSFLFLLILTSTVFTVHLINRPFWSYYALHLHIVLSLLTACFLSWVMTSNRFKAKAISLVAIIAFLTFRMNLLIQEVNFLNEQPKVSQSKALKKVFDNKVNDDWFFTDRPIFAFYAKMKMPPELAVIPKKRSMGGLLSEKEKVDYLRLYQPAQILLFYEPSDLLKEFLDEDYILVLPQKAPFLFISKEKR